MFVRIAVISRFFLCKALEWNCSLEKIAQMPTGNKLFSEKHKNTLNVSTGLVQIWFPTKHWGIELFSERNTRTYGVFCLFKSATHTHFGYRMVQIWFLTEGARKIESWRPGFTGQGQRESAGIQGGLREGGPRVLVLYQESGPAVFQEFAAQF